MALERENIPMKILCPNCGRKLDVSELEPFTEVLCPQCGNPLKVPCWFTNGILLEDILYSGEDLSIYRSLEPALDREAVVKVVSLGGNYGQDCLDKFLEAARRQALVVNRSVASIYTCGLKENSAYVVSQYSANAKWPAAPIKDMEMFCDIATGILSALEVAASSGLYHGNVCPQNVLFNADGEVLLTDFGVWYALSREATVYTSPEMVSGNPPTVTSDVYSAGVCLYELACGRLPARKGIIPACELNPGVPKVMSDMLTAMLNKDAASRPAVYSKLIEAFTLPKNDKSGQGKKKFSLAPQEGKKHQHVIVKHGTGANGAISRQAAPQKNGGVLSTLLKLGMLLFLMVAIVLGVMQIIDIQKAKQRDNALFDVNKEKPTKDKAAAKLQAEAKAEAEPVEIGENESTVTGKTVSFAESEDGEEGTVAVNEDTVAVNEDTVAVNEESIESAHSQAVEAARQVVKEQKASKEKKAKSAGGESSVVVLKYKVPKKCVAARPRPDDLDFRKCKEQNSAYLKMLPEELRDAEKEKLRLVGTSLDYLCQCMKFGPYDRGDNGKIRLRSGKFISGIIPFAPRDGKFMVRYKDGKNSREVKIEEIKFEQLLDMFQYYAEKREEMAPGKMKNGKKKLSSSLRTDISDAYLVIACLCDWYDMPDLAAGYTAKALKYRPARREEFYDLGLPVPRLGKK